MRKQAAVRQADILGVLKKSAVPLTAYQILETLREEEPAIAPPTVYRALDALTDQGKAHRLASLKAFVPCRCDHGNALQVIAICDTCGAVEEHDGTGLLEALVSLAGSNHFSPKKHMIEIQGQCASCA